MAADVVNHPPHYQSETGLEVIDVIEAFTFDLKGIEAVDTGNVLKYICRWKKKGGIQDLEKAKWYLEHLITKEKKAEKWLTEDGLTASTIDYKANATTSDLTYLTRTSRKED